MNYLLKQLIIVLVIIVFLISCKKSGEDKSSESKFLVINIETTKQFQTIKCFGASDAWACQFVGKNWPVEKRELIADYLFSNELKPDGSPKGIGLSSWRFNIGAGSTEQGNSSSIADEWRRAEGFMQPDGSFDWTKQQGQRWFLNAAKSRGVNVFVGFVNSPPVALTKNQKAFSAGGSSTNLKTENFDAFAKFLVDVTNQIKLNDGIEFDYLSPFNEPQWDWNEGNQEGSPWLNSEMAAFCRKLNLAMAATTLKTKIEITEAAQINYLYENGNKSGRANQLDEFFKSKSTNYIGNLEYIAPKIVAHSYFTTWDLNYAISTREKLASKLAAYPNLEYSMSEYTILENNEEIKGEGRDLGIDPALYLARVMHLDLTIANANSWMWWLAVSPYNYKNGLVFIDWNKNDGKVYDSKMLWAMGNYSRYIRPGMKRIGISRSDSLTIEQSAQGLMVSSYFNPENGKTVSVAINYSKLDIPVVFLKDSSILNCTIYRTAAGIENLSRIGSTDFTNSFIIKGRSITTFVEN